eukprot:4104970-Amphidinium_carterae.1
MCADCTGVCCTIVSHTLTRPVGSAVVQASCPQHLCSHGFSKIVAMTIVQPARFTEVAHWD